MPTDSALPSIVVVDDRDEDIFLIEQAINRTGTKHAIETFESGQALLQHLQETHLRDPAASPAPCLMVLDVRMAMVDGFDVFEWVRRHSRFDNTKVVMISAFDDPAFEKRAADLGAFGYVRKSDASASLPQLVEAACAAA